jgi:hypothetical protein
MRLGRPAVALLAAISATFSLSDAAHSTSIQYHVPGTTFVLHKRNAPVQLKYPKITWIEEPFTLQCLATTCAIDVQAEANSNAGNAITPCTYMDGKPLSLKCTSGGNGINVMQGGTVSQGTHTFRTGVINPFEATGSACPCSVKYTLYDSGN